mgnify:CR=1 FL=1
MKRIQQIFQDHGPAYMQRFGDAMPEAHRKVIDAICECRTGARGHHVFECPDCSQKHVANSSCGNRHCPVCQHHKGVQWVYRQQQRLLPCNYFLVTFTLPEGLRDCARTRPAQVYRALFDEAAASLRELTADKRFVGCKIAGFTGVLHTWGRQIQYHPHVHFIVAGGGLNEDRDRWIASRGNFLVHVKALSRLFRGKFKARLKQMGLLEAVPAEAWTDEWVVNCRHVGSGVKTLKYLGAYLFRVAISDARIVAYDGKSVTFKWQKVGSARWRKTTLPVMEFMRRYLQHVLPGGFMRVRHFGFLSRRFGLAIDRIRELILALGERFKPTQTQLDAPKPFKPLLCPRCRAVMTWSCFLPPLRASGT